jgi:hypothetical protein
MTPEERARWLEIADRHDRECADLQACCEMATSEATALIRHLIAAVADEREACAKIAEQACNLTAEIADGRPPRSCHSWCHQGITAAIRRRR